MSVESSDDNYDSSNNENDNAEDNDVSVTVSLKRNSRSSSESEADVTFLVGEDKVSITSHKDVLSLASKVFKAMFNGELREQGESIEIPDCEPEAFKKLITYLYNDQIDLKTEDVCEVYYAAKKYQLESLIEVCVDFMKKNVGLTNCVSYYMVAKQFEEVELRELCLACIADNIADVFKLESTLSLSGEDLAELLSHDELHSIDELTLFQFVKLWIYKNHDLDSKLVLASIRLSRMTSVEIDIFVKPTGLYSFKSLFRAVVDREGKEGELGEKPLGSGYKCVRNENVATAKHGAKLLSGLSYINYDLFGPLPDDYRAIGGFVYHNYPSRHGITIELGGVYKLNKIDVLLYEYDNTQPYSYAFYIDISKDGETWFRVADQSKQLCCSWQLYEFKPKLAKYVRLLGVNEPKTNNLLRISAIRCLYVQEP